MTIRRAKKSDHAALAALCDDFLAGQRAMEPVLLGNGECPGHSGREMIESAGKGKGGYILLAEEAGEIWGFIGVEDTTAEPSAFFAPHLYAKINFLYVAEAHQGGGVGRALVAAAEEVARESGREYLSLHTFDNNTAARAFYKAEGFSEARIWMRKKL